MRILTRRTALVPDPVADDPVPESRIVNAPERPAPLPVASEPDMVTFPPNPRRIARLRVSSDIAHLGLCRNEDV